MKKLIYLLIFCIPLFSQGQELLKQVQNKYNDINSISASFVQNVKNEKNKINQKMQGKLVYKKGNKIRVEFDKITIVTDGKSTWNYDSRLKRLIISKAEDNPSSFSFEAFVFNYPAKCNVEYKNENGSRQIILTPKTGKREFKKAILIVAPDNLIKEINIIDNSETFYQIELLNTEINSGIPDTVFNFSTPSGAKVVDLR